MGMGADVRAGCSPACLVVTLIVPVFAWRHYVVDKGKFPEDMRRRPSLVPEEGVKSGAAGVLRFLAIAAGVVVVVVAHSLRSLS
jgi:hypothetical protein